MAAVVGAVVVGAGLAACGGPSTSLSATHPTGVWHVKVPGAQSGGAGGATSPPTDASTTTTTGATGSAVPGTGSAPPATVTGGPVGGPTSTTSAPPSTSSSTTSTTAPLTRPAGTGAYGYVTAGPTCPVERANQPCPPQAVSAEVDARTGSGATVASTRSDTSGRYSLGLAPGSYTLVVVTSSGGPRCPDTPVTVQAGAATRADISCDTGIR